MSPDEPLAVDGLLAVADGLTQIIELAAGHRNRALAAGFSNEAAEEMAVEVHRKLVDLIGAGAPANPTASS